MRMRALIIFVLCLDALTNAEGFQGTGPYFPTLMGWIYTYETSIVPDLDVSYNVTSSEMGLQAIVEPSGGYNDFVLIDSVIPSPDVQLNPNIQMFPLIGSTIVPQFNLPSLTSNNPPLVLSREAIVGIMMGNITRWNDPAITITNSGLLHALPNTTITVVYRSDDCGTNAHLSSILSAFSPLWAATYGVSSTWPTQLQGLSNAIPAFGETQINAKIIAYPYSISYAVPYDTTTRDNTMQVACIQNKFNYIVCPNRDTIEAAMKCIITPPDLLFSTYSIESDANHTAWISAAYFHLVVPITLDSSQWGRTRDFYKFLRWVLTEQVPQDQATISGLVPLSGVVVNLVLNRLGQITCDGRSVLSLEPTNKRTYVHQILIALNSVFLAFVVFLSITHLYVFKSSTINAVYTLLFLLGASITLSATYVWDMIPEQNGVCVARAWLTSMGLALLLGTMFSRTWQLKDIYNLQKKTIDGLQAAITVRSSVIKLALTIALVACVNFTLLLTWTLVDPYSARLTPADSQLDGTWTCVSTHLSIWMFFQISLLSFLISFGVYVVYKTWAFQRASVVRETRWVLLVLYNIILNIVAAFPSAYISKANDETLAVLMMASLMFSGGGIVIAFLLPRLLRKYRHRKDKDQSRESIDGRPSPPSTPYNRSSGLQLTPKTALSIRIPYQTAGTETNQSSILDPLGSFSHSLSSKQSSLYHSEISPSSSVIAKDSTTTQKEVELIAVKKALGEPTDKRAKGIKQPAQEGILEDEEDVESSYRSNRISTIRKPTMSEVDVSITTRQLLIPRDDQRADTPDRTPIPPNKLLWSSNPLAGTETNSPVEE